MVKRCFSASGQLGHNNPCSLSETRCLEAVLRSGTATERQSVRFPGQRMLLFFGQIFLQNEYLHESG